MKRIEILLALVMVIFSIAGCTRGPVCGDGVCSIDEDATNTCPQDCEKFPDVVVNNMELEGEALAYNDNKVEINVVNNGYAPSEIKGELEIYFNDRKHHRRMIDFKDYEFDNILNVGESINLHEHLWLWQSGWYKVKFKIDSVNKEDLIQGNNFREIEFYVEKPSYPEYLIEKDIGGFRYDHSRKSDWLEFEFNDNPGKMYEAEYYGSYAQTRVSVYDDEIDMYKFRDVMNDRFDEYRLELEYYEGQYFYVVEPDYYYYEKDNTDIQVYWLSDNKIIRLYFWVSYNDEEDLEEFLIAYLEKHPSSITSNILCGNGRCDRQYRSLSVGGTTTLNEYKITLLEINSSTNWISIDVDDKEYSLENDEVLMIDGAYVNIQNKGTYSWEYCIYPEDTIVNFTVVDYDQDCVEKLYDSCGVEGVEISPRWISSYDDEVQFYSDEGEWTSMKVGETRFIGNIRIHLNKIDGEKECETKSYAHLNLGENDKTCSEDCMMSPGGGGGGGSVKPVPVEVEEEWNPPEKEPVEG